MLLLGVIQAQASGGAAAGSFDLLETQVLSSSAASVTFSGLSAYAADYQHLQIRMTARTTRASTTSLIDFRLNGDTGSNYAYHALTGTGSAVSSTAATTTTAIRIPTIGDTSTANIFSGSVIDFLDPFSESKNKTIRALSGNNPFRVQLSSGLWASTSAMTSITFYDFLSNNLVSGSRFSLYGIKAGA